MKAFIVFIVFLNLSLIYSFDFERDLRTLGKNVTTDDIKELRKELFITRGYDKYARPIPKKDGLKVMLQYSLIHISEFCLRSQTITTDGWLWFQWHDESLKWETTQFNHIKNIRVPAHEVYKPDIMIYNGVDHNTQKLVNTNVIIYSSGLVLWVPPITSKALCRVNLKKWPYDEHICLLKLGSWTHDGDIMDVWPMNATNPQFLRDYWTNTEFDMTFLNITREIKHYDCCVEPYPSITWYFKLQRKPSLYCYIISVPVIVAIIMSLISFWFPIRSNIRFLFNSMSFLTLTLILLFLGNQLGFSAIGIPIAVRFISITTLLVGLLQIWSMISYNISLLKCQIPVWTMKMTKPLLQMYRNSEHESIQLTEPMPETKKTSQPNAEDLTYIIDKLVFVIFVFAVAVNALV